MPKLSCILGRKTPSFRRCPCLGQLPPGQINAFKSFLFRVESDRSAAIQRAQSENGITLAGVVTDLMRVN